MPVIWQANIEFLLCHKNFIAWFLMVSQDIAKAKINFNEGFVYFKQNTVLGYLMKIKKK